MPTYEYRCPEGHEFERFQKMTDPARARCPVCGRSATRQISGGAGLIFKGSGFYITDYGKDGKGPAREQGTGDRGQGAGEVEKSAESKESTKDSTKDSTKESTKESTADKKPKSPKKKASS